MKFDIITIFPKIFDSYFNESIIKRAQKKKKIKIKAHDLRDYTTDKHKTVDDKPYGGGVGMVMKVEPVYRALRAIKKAKKQKSNRTILFTPAGKTFNQNMARRLTKYKRITMVCPRYEGHDARIEKLVDEKISIGDYILTGGEIPAMIVVDAVTRLLPGVLGKDESIKDESFSQEGYIEYPQYTRPENFKNMKAPKVLLSGHHKKIAEWKDGCSKNKP
ncbi:tRNA (guanosine(37)-N1)-methyltransferase TrmD [Patescibacteria group bacterium]|nr:tRNA (guanosine(37)-N1)-methyltransferase TrmD [Patescibacteria group bacterium]MCG2693484.1 tRNA (guanosine(37)-N1)-methyltransferase TrmD [Candidatus Parcubacteria bacterium]